MTIFQYLQAFFSLAVLFGILFGVLKLSNTVKAKKFSGEISIVDRVPIESQVTLMIVKVRNKELLIGVGGKNITILDQFN